MTWVDGAFEPNVQVVLSETGLIEQVGYLDRKPTLRLPGRALLPGMVSAHSHAFQRGLRGFTETFDDGTPALRAWRNALYELASCLDAEEFRSLCHVAFEEMLHHGITSVGEFHYFHHSPEGRDYAFDDVLLEVASEVGIRLVLMCGYYARGGIGQPLLQEQRRFGSESVEVFCGHVDRLREKVNRGPHTVGIAAHSLRAATPDEVVKLAAYARLHDLPFHINVETVRSEVDDCRAVYGASPVELLLDRGLIGPSTTLIHGTHMSADVLRRVAQEGGLICVCPLTEGSLGLGWVDVPTFAEAGGCVCLGTDSNARISLNEEMRWLEYAHRARHETRGVLADGQGRSANALWGCATENGAKSLNLKVGRIASGCLADLIALDIRGLSLLGSTRESLLAAFVFGADRAAITDVCVGGKWRALGA